MSAIKEMIPEVIKTGDYATCSLQIPKGVSGELPFLLNMTNSFCETGRQGWYGTRVHCSVLHDDGETLRAVAHKDFEMTRGQDELAAQIMHWMHTLGACHTHWSAEIESALCDMIPC